MALSHGRESVDNASTRHDPYGEDVELRTRDVLFLRRADLAEGSERIQAGVQ